MDRNVLEGGRGAGFIDGAEEHGAFILVKEFRGRVDVVVCSGVGAADYHYCVALRGGGGGVVDAVVVYRGLEEVGVGFQPISVKLALCICILGSGCFVSRVFCF